jgi:transposase
MPARRGPSVTDRLFREHPAFFRARDRLQVKYELLRAQAVDARPVRTVCQAFGFSRQSFYTLRERFRTKGLEGLLPRRPGRVGPTKCTAEIVTFLRDTKSDDPTLSGAALAARVEKRFGIRLHRRTVERVLGLRRRRTKKD